MLGALEILLIIIVVGVLALLQVRTRSGSLFPYLAVVILLLALILAVRVIHSLVSLVIVLVLLCGFLLWRVARSARRSVVTRDL